eukprot:6491817-Amphidinium_carterae.1
MLRCRKLRIAGDLTVPKCWPFGTYVTLRVPGGLKSFAPFEARGKLGRLLWQDVGSRLCYAVSPSGDLVKGFAAAPVLYQGEPAEALDDHLANLATAGWKQINLEDGAQAWLHEADGVLSLVCPCIVDVAETSVFPSNVMDADVAEVETAVQIHPLEEEVYHECNRRVHFREPVVEELVTFWVKSITVETASRARSLRARRHPELDVYAETAYAMGDACCLKDVAFGNLGVPGYRLDAHTAGLFNVTPAVRASIAEASLRQLPANIEEMSLSKMVPVDQSAVRNATGEERVKWYGALEKEFENLVSQGTFETLDADGLSDAQRAAMAPGRVVLSLKPIDTTGGERGAKRKARIVLCGNFVPDYSSSATKNLDVAAFRCFLNIVVRRQWLLATLDVPGAFLHADLPDREVILLPPKLLTEYGIVRKGQCWRLKKALYGLKEAPRLWQSRRDADLAALRFLVTAEGKRYEAALWRSRVHDSIWILVWAASLPELEKRVSTIDVRRSSMEVLTPQEELLDSGFLEYMSGITVLGLVCVYVDDLAIGAKKGVIDALSVALDGVYGTGRPKTLGIDGNEVVYLGMQIELVKSVCDASGELQSYGELLIHQTRYLEELIDAHSELFHGGRDSPAEPDSFSRAVERKEVDPETLKLLQRIGGSLLWLVTRSRADIAFAHSRLASLQSRDTASAWTILRSLCSYLFKHSEFGISVVGGAQDDALLSYTDISFAPEGSRSQAGVLVQWGQSTLTWRSFRQTLTTLSTCESELIGVVDGLESAKCLQILLSELAFDIAPRMVELRCDNQASISLSSETAPLRTRHLSIRALRLSEALKQGSCTLGWVGTKDQRADYLTKPVTRAFQRACLHSLGMKQCKSLCSGGSSGSSH